MNVAHLIKSFTLWEFVKAHWLTLKYFFKPKATIRYSMVALVKRGGLRR